MGIWGTLGTVGAAQAAAERQSRQDAIEKAYLQVQQQYAQTNQERFALDKAREARLTAQQNQPQYLYHVEMPDGTTVQASQMPTGGTKWEVMPYAPNSKALMKDIDDTLSEFKDQPEYEAVARRAIKPKLDLGDYKGALAILEQFSLPYAKTKLPSAVTTSEGTGMVPIEIGGVPYMIQYPTVRTTTKGPATPGTAGAVPAAPSVSPITPPSSPAGVPALPPGMPAGSKIFGVKPTAQTEKQALSPADLTAMRILKTSLVGDPTETDPELKEGLMGALKPLDSTRHRYVISKLMDLEEEKGGMFHSEKLMGLQRMLDEDDKRYMRLMRRARGTIGGLRMLTGKNRPTDAFIQRQLRELPDPATTDSAEAGRKRLALIMQEIGQVGQSAPSDAGGAGPPSTGDPVKDYLQSIGVSP